MKFNPQELAEAPKITVAGQQYPVPPLAPRQIRRIIPRITRLQSLLKNKGMDQMSEEDMDAAYECVYWALTRAHPDLEYKDFMDWPIPMRELRNAIPIIVEQTGIMDNKASAPVSGEAKEESPSTGTSSSPV